MPGDRRGGTWRGLATAQARGKRETQQRCWIVAGAGGGVGTATVGSPRPQPQRCRGCLPQRWQEVRRLQVTVAMYSLIRPYLAATVYFSLCHRLVVVLDAGSGHPRLRRRRN